jgi:hypothetical protein
VEGLGNSVELKRQLLKKKMANLMKTFFNVQSCSSAENRSPRAAEEDIEN